MHPPRVGKFPRGGYGGGVSTPIELSGGNNGGTELEACTGECDRDSDCVAGLKCFQRSNGEPIPGASLCRIPRATLSSLHSDTCRSEQRCRSVCTSLAPRPDRSVLLHVLHCSGLLQGALGSGRGAGAGRAKLVLHMHSPQSAYTRSTLGCALLRVYRSGQWRRLGLLLRPERATNDGHFAADSGAD